MYKYYFLIRNLHLYLGLLVSPFVMVFCIGLLVFNHPGLVQKTAPANKLPDIQTKLHGISYNGPDLEVAREIINELEIAGEIDFISKNKNSISFPVNKPGLRMYVWVNTTTDSVKISREYEGPLRATAYLHSMPGPHNIKIRGNALFMKIWSGIADGVVYLLMFITISGVILWFAAGFERTSGIITLISGLLFFAVLLLTF